MPFAVPSADRFVRDVFGSAPAAVQYEAAAKMQHAGDSPLVRRNLELVGALLRLGVTDSTSLLWAINSIADANTPVRIAPIDPARTARTLALLTQDPTFSNQVKTSLVCSLIAQNTSDVLRELPPHLHTFRSRLVSAPSRAVTGGLSAADQREWALGGSPDIGAARCFAIAKRGGVIAELAVQNPLLGARHLEQLRTKWLLNDDVAVLLAKNPNCSTKTGSWLVRKRPSYIGPVSYGPDPWVKLDLTDVPATPVALHELLALGLKTNNVALLERLLLNPHLSVDSADAVRTFARERALPQLYARASAHVSRSAQAVTPDARVFLSEAASGVSSIADFEAGATAYFAHPALDSGMRKEVLSQWMQVGGSVGDDGVPWNLIERAPMTSQIAQLVPSFGLLRPPATIDHHVVEHLVDHGHQLDHAHLAERSDGLALALAGSHVVPTLEHTSKAEQLMLERATVWVHERDAWPTGRTGMTIFDLPGREVMPVALPRGLDGRRTITVDLSDTCATVKMADSERAINRLSPVALFAFSQMPDFDNRGLTIIATIEMNGIEETVGVWQRRGNRVVPYGVIDADVDGGLLLVDELGNAQPGQRRINAGYRSAATSEIEVGGELSTVLYRAAAQWTGALTRTATSTELIEPSGRVL